jgi:hypothetical protein
MAEAAIRSEGNLRFAGKACMGYPVDLAEQARLIADLVSKQDGVSAYGPPTLLFTLPPHGEPGTWEGQVGTAVTGLPVPADQIRVEDYHDLRSCWIAHTGPIQELPETHRKLTERARSQGFVVRPYWRVQLWRRRLADGSPLPVCEVSVFLERF